MTLLLTLGKAFLVGGLICVIGQLLIDRTALTPGKILVLFVVCGVVLGGVGLYGPLADFAGEGAAVPIKGFGYALAKGTKEAVDCRRLPYSFENGSRRLRYFPSCTYSGSPAGAASVSSNTSENISRCAARITELDSIGTSTPNSLLLSFISLASRPKTMLLLRFQMPLIMLLTMCSHEDDTICSAFSLSSDSLPFFWLEKMSVLVKPGHTSPT